MILAVSDVARFRAYELARSGKRDEALASFADSYRILKEGKAKHPKAPEIYLALAAHRPNSGKRMNPNRSRSSVKDWVPAPTRQHSTSRFWTTRFARGRDWRSPRRWTN